jgi:hypothetical protein
MVHGRFPQGQGIDVIRDTTQVKSMAAAQRAKPLKKQSCQGRGNQGAAAAAALLSESFPFG